MDFALFRSNSFPKKRALAACLAWALLPLIPAGVSAQLLNSESELPNSFVISDIRVDGLSRISTGTVLTYLPVERGDRMDTARSSDALRSLYRTGFFEDIKFSREGDILVITVQERPAISKVTLVGNKDIKEPDLRKALAGIGLSEGEVYNRLIIDKVQQELTRQYYNRGKYNVKVTPTVKRLDRNRVEVTVAVGEGKASKIKHINIVGNKRFTDAEIMEEFESRTSNWLSWYKRDDQYAKEKVQGDLEKLRSYYLDRGYVDMDIESTQVSISPDRRNIYVTANINEGEIYKIRETKLTGEFVLGQETLEPLVFTAKGDIFSRKRLEQTSEAIKGVLANVGYAFAEVEFIPDIDRDKREVGITFFVNPGKRVMVRRINFTGNSKTMDEVLRREMRQLEGGWFAQSSLDRSKIRLQRLGFFEDVKLDTEKVAGSDDLVDVKVEVKERQSGNFQFGFGYSALQGLITNMSLQQENFLGRGNRVGVAISNNIVSRRFDFSYFNPYWTDDGISRGFNLSFNENDFSRYNTGETSLVNFQSDTIDLSSVFSFPVTETDRINLQLGVDQNKLRLNKSQAETPQAFTDFIRGEGGRDCGAFPVFGDTANPGLITGETFLQDCADFRALRAQVGWARDTRNAFYVPTDGYYARVGAEVTLPPSDLRYYKITAQYQRFFPLWNNFVFMTNTDIGYGDTYGKTNFYPFFEYFYGGGVRSVRGFRDNSLGPRYQNCIPSVDPQSPDPICSQSYAIGGALNITQNLELIVPTPFAKDRESVRLAAFLDIGNVFADVDSFKADELRYSVGLSMQWRSPVAPIIISFAQPLNDKPGDDVEQLQFTFFNNL